MSVWCIRCVTGASGQFVDGRRHARPPTPHPPSPTHTHISAHPHLVQDRGSQAAPASVCTQRQVSKHLWTYLTHTTGPRLGRAFLPASEWSLPSCQRAVRAHPSGQSPFLLQFPLNQHYPRRRSSAKGRGDVWLYGPPKCHPAPAAAQHPTRALEKALHPAPEVGACQPFPQNSRTCVALQQQMYGAAWPVSYRLSPYWPRSTHHSPFQKVTLRPRGTQWTVTWHGDRQLQPTHSPPQTPTTSTPHPALHEVCQQA